MSSRIVKEIIREEKWLMREIKFLEDFRQDAQEIVTSIEKLGLDGVEQATVVSKISQLVDLAKRIEKEFSESNRVLLLITYSERKRVVNEGRLIKSLKNINENFEQTTKQQILNTIESIYVYSAQLLTELARHTGRLNGLIGEEGEYVSKLRLFVTKRNASIFSSEFFRSFSLKSNLIREDVENIVRAAKALLVLLEDLKRLIQNLDLVVKSKENTKRSRSGEKSDTTLFFRIREIRKRVDRLREQASGIIDLEYHGNIVREETLYFFVNSLLERFFNPSIEYFEDKPLNSLFLDNYHHSLEECRKLMSSENFGKKKYYIYLIRKRLEKEIELLEKDNKITPAFVRELEHHVTISERAISYFSALRLKQVTAFEDVIFLTHTTSKNGLEQMIKSGVMLSAKDTNHVVHTLQLDRLLNLDNWNFFAINWGIIRVQDYALVYDAKKFLKINVDINYVKHDQGVLGFLFLYLLLKKLSATSSELPVHIRKKAEAFCENFSRQRDLRIANYSVDEIVSALPDSEIRKFLPQFEKEHVLPNQEKSRTKMWHYIKDHSKDLRSHDISEGRFSMFDERLPEIRASSPFPVFNEALVGFFVPSREVVDFARFLKTTRNEVDDLVIYTRPSGGMISKIRVRDVK